VIMHPDFWRRYAEEHEQDARLEERLFLSDKDRVRWHRAEAEKCRGLCAAVMVYELLRAFRCLRAPA